MKKREKNNGVMQAMGMQPDDETEMVADASS